MITTTDALVDLYFTLEWEKDGIRHTDRYFADEANLYRDYFPLGLDKDILGKIEGDTIRRSFGPGELVPRFSGPDIRKVRLSFVDTNRIDGLPKKGRFYPKGILSRVTEVFPENVTPFRAKDVDDTWVHADFNHPLSDRPLTLTVEILDIKAKKKERGGLCNDWIEALVSGPGIQARENGSSADFFTGTPFARDDEHTDGEFYRGKRMISHIDELARKNLADLYGKILKPGDRILDLMSSWDSHLPENLTLKSVTGFGMNRDELSANPRLTDVRVHDLNESPEIPAPDGSFDAVICSLSVEYLTRPFEVFRDIARVLRPGGQCVITFSNRWFPTKAIRLWPRLHEFERMGLVLEYMRAAGLESLETQSMRGFPRPYTDDYFPGIKLSDPIYMVRGIKAC
jgi:SAM-dependent methyltransferase